MRPIDADVLVKKFEALKEWETLFNTYGTAILETNNMPTLDIMPIKHAHWKITPIGDGYDNGVDAECSCCKHILWDYEDEITVKYENHFCLNCGAQMDEEVEE